MELFNVIESRDYFRNLLQLTLIVFTRIFPKEMLSYITNSKNSKFEKNKNKRFMAKKLQQYVLWTSFLRNVYP